MTTASDGEAADRLIGEARPDLIVLDLMLPKLSGYELCRKADRVLGLEEVLAEVWGYEALPQTRTVDNHVASLRAKLEPGGPGTHHIQTVHGAGYKFVP